MHTIDLAKQFLDSGRVSEAIDILQALADHETDNAALQLELGRAYYMNSDYKNSIATLKKALCADETDLKDHIYTLLLKSLMECEHYTEIKDIIISMDGCSPGILPVFRELCNFLREARRYDIAIIVLEKYVTFAADDMMFIVELLQLLNFTGDHAGAEQLAVSALENPSKLSPFNHNRIINELEISRKKTTLRSKPRIMLVTLTNRCNLSCPMCGKGNDQWDIKPDLIEEIITLLPYLELMTWQGGEVFLYDGFKKVLDESKSLDHLKQIIITNALLIDDSWAELLCANSGIDLTVSIDSINQNLYENLRCGGRFDRLLENLHRINHLKEKTGSDLGMTMRFTVMKENYREIQHLGQFAADLGFEVLLLYPIDESPEQHSGGEDIFSENDNEIISMLNRDRAILAESCRKNRIKLLDWLPPSEEHPENTAADISPSPLLSSKTEKENILNNINISETFHCFRPWKQISVRVNGTIYPECLCEEALGDIFNDSFLELWNSKKMQEYRAKIIKGDRSWCGQSCRNGQIPSEHLKFTYI
jgi:MoaA/NifB/PqqE/SkfB family radical SAM enzyme